MAYGAGDLTIGIDIMKCELPQDETVESYLNTLSSFVRDIDDYPFPPLGF